MSVFTFDPDPPRVLSPWPPTAARTEQARAAGSQTVAERCGVTRLPPEPQDGPVEYKLHLLLRPRRPYRSLSASPASTDPPFLQQTRVVASTTAGQTRQDRCQHLTTQLLWRLRQSSPYHASVAHNTDVVLPLLPDDASITTLPVTLGKLAPGLEESHGALYEIGVADDGTLTGITQEELDQSIATLRWMAANLGCVSEVQRMVVVGECEWTDEDSPQSGGTQRASLWVAEVFVRPHLHGANAGSAAQVTASEDGPAASSEQNAKGLSTTLGLSTTDQLRVTLTGPTGSGKSTLLGTLSTGTLDDGHGKSRLHSLKHRHEMDSGLTSTVTQELVGYTDNTIVNYANPNIESWIGIHDYTKNGRLVFLSDSAGHPRFRRTTLRGLVGWAPHWTLLCLGAATDAADPGSGSLPAGSAGSSSGGSFGSPAVLSDFTTGAGSATLAKAHLDLCLDLDLPLVVLITKSDLLTKESLKRTLTPIWTAVKKAGRTPLLLQSRQKVPEDVRLLSPDDIQAVDRVLAHVGGDTGHSAREVVPVVLTSAVSGDGIGLVHALLRGLPRPPTPTAHDYSDTARNPEQPEALFHIGDRFSRPASYAAASLGQTADPGHVVSGYLRFGSLSVGDRVVMGPFPADAADGADATVGGDASESDQAVVAAAHPSSSPWELAQLSAAAAAAAKDSTSAPPLAGEWYDARIVSIRNLRLPVQTLAADQVGSIGLVVEAPASGGGGEAQGLPPPQRLKPRRGMVLAAPSRHMVDSGLRLQAARGLTAFFGNAHVGLLAAGTLVTFYVASVRAQARIAKIWRATAAGADADNDGEGGDGAAADADTDAQQGYNVQLELLLGREWIELGGKIVLLEGASREGFLLDGFIGKVVALVD